MSSKEKKTFLIKHQIIPLTVKQRGQFPQFAHVYDYKKAGLKNDQIIDLISEIKQKQENQKEYSAIVLMLGLSGDPPCRYLSKVKWDNLRYLSLICCQIGDIGCKHLAKGQWKKLFQLTLWLNEIGQRGCKYLVSASWDQLDTIDLEWNFIGPEGCRFLAANKWKKLSSLLLRTQFRMLGGNFIALEGYAYLQGLKCEVNCEQEYSTI